MRGLSAGGTCGAQRVCAMSGTARILVDGNATGEVLRLTAPISFWGGVDPATGEIIANPHPQNGANIAGKIVVAPRIIGSSGTSAVMLELAYAGLAPKAVILGEPDPILSVGSIVAREMGWPVAPVLVLENLAFETGQWLEINGGEVTQIGDARPGLDPGPRSDLLRR